jgi:hypothetical protein
MSVKESIIGCVAVVCVLLIACLVSQGQTLVIPAESDQTKTQPNPCVNCIQNLAPAKELGGAKQPAANGELPDAPGFVSSESRDAVVWDLAEPIKSTNSAPPPRIWDKKMLAAHLFLAGSIVFDVEATHQGIAHHMCVEGNSDLNRKPSRGELYLDNLEQFAPMVLMDSLGALTGRSAHLPRWAWKAIGYEGPVIGSTLHLRAGIQWFTQCW